MPGELALCFSNARGKRLDLPVIACVKREEPIGLANVTAAEENGWSGEHRGSFAK